jgi:hypothetical protein
MGLIFDVLSAINNPKQQASIDSLSSIVNGVQQLAGTHGLDSAATQSVLSSVGSQLRSGLQQQVASGNPADLAGLIGKFAAGNSNLSALQSLIPESAQQQLLQTLTQKAGLNSASALGLVGTLAPLLLKFLNQGAPAQGSAGGSNPILTAFLDSNHDGNVDLGDAFRFASRFLSR